MASIETKTISDDTVRHRVQWREGGARTGKRQTFTFDTIDEAERFRDLINAHRNITPKPDVLESAGFGYLLGERRPATVPTFVAYAYTHVNLLTSASDHTKADYRSLIARDLEPFFKADPITSVQRSRLREWQDWMSRTPEPDKGIEGRGVSDKTIRNTRGTVVNPVLRRAMLHGENGEPPLLTYNPLDGLDAPSGRSKKRNIVGTAEEASAIIRAAYEHDADAADLIVTLIATGMRWGEAAGLPPHAVDVAALKLDIVQVAARNLARLPDVPYLYLRPEPKTDAGWRTIPFGEAVGAMFARRLATPRRLRKSNTPPLDLMFPSITGGILANQNFTRNHYRPILAKAMEYGLPHTVTPHGLRRSLLTLLAESKVDPVTLHSVAGHKDHKTTLKLYTEPTGRGYADVRTAVDTLLSAAMNEAA